MPTHHARRSLYSDNDDDDDDEVSGWSVGSVATSRSDGDGEERAAAATAPAAAGTDMDLHAPRTPASPQHVTHHPRDNNRVRKGVSSSHVVASSRDNAPAQGQSDAVTAAASTSPPAPYQQSCDDLDMAVVMQLIADIDGLSGGGDSEGEEEEEEEEEASSPGAVLTTGAPDPDWRNVRLPHHWIPRPTLQHQHRPAEAEAEPEEDSSRCHPAPRAAVNPPRNPPGDRPQVKVYRTDSYRAAAEQCCSAVEDSPPCEHERGLATWRPRATPGSSRNNGHLSGSDTRAPAREGVTTLFERSAGHLGEIMMMNAQSGMMVDRAGDRLDERVVDVAGELVLGEAEQAGSSDSRLSGSVNSRQAGRGDRLDQFKNSQEEESQRKQSKRITVITV